MKEKLIVVAYIAIIVLVIGWLVMQTISYMSLNNWDLRCVFVDCKVVTTRELQNEQRN